MIELKKGDLVEVKIDFTEEFKIGDVFSVSSVHGNSAILSTSVLLHKSFLKKIGESKMQYEESNRYKLSQAVKKTGLKVYDLSLAASNNTNTSYFTNYQAKSRFNKRGDISEARLSELLTDLHYAEREVLGIGAKTVSINTTHKNSFENSVRAIVEMNKALKNPKHNDHVDALSYGVNAFKDHPCVKEESASSKRPLILFLIVVILASFYFLNLSFGWV